MPTKNLRTHYFLAAEVQVVQADGGHHLQEPERAFTEETREQEGQEAGSPRETGNHSGSEVRAFFQCCGCFWASQIRIHP